MIHDSGQPFAIVRAVPTAALNRSRYLLLVFSDNRTAEERANDAAQAQENLDALGGGPVIPATVPKTINSLAARLRRSHHLQRLRPRPAPPRLLRPNR